MQEERIRLGSTDSAMSVNRDNFVDVNIIQHTKVFPFTSISDTIDQMEVFENERSECNKYRIILTISPYCSNILFNAVTEVVRYEGSDDFVLVGDGVDDMVNLDKLGDYTVKGKTRSLKRSDMIRNTEYSNGGDDGFVYHCGYDIFNNHILRNNTFKVVNAYVRTKGENDDFNTIKDYMRDLYGQDIKSYHRNGLNIIKTKDTEKTHLYLKDDIMNVSDTINANLFENNGWFGFGNRSTIESKQKNEEEVEWVDMSISRVLNGEHMPCEFIEMYPDSSLYSFNPKYNKNYNRDEYNWDICLTYPYENVEDDMVLVTDGTHNSLLLASFRFTVGLSGQDIILFRSYIKHNLKESDTIKLFVKTTADGEYNEIEDTVFKVTNVGNLKGEYEDYYFYLNDVTTIKNVLPKNPVTKEIITENVSFRFVKTINNVDCKYYYRKFKKLPNLKLKREELTKDVALNSEEFENYVDNNCKKDGKMLLFNKEQYPLAFSKTVYGDSKTQIVFTDTIDIDKIVDNLGRPLSEIYVTIIKRNAGHDKWYLKDKENVEEIEYSHCFSNVSAGLEIHGEMGDTDKIMKERRTIGDSVTITSIYSGNGKSTYGEPIEDNITLEDNDVFYGDVVELNPFEMKETVLSDVHFRFNTEQREHNFNENEKKITFLFEEIEMDDYDSNGFVCNTYNADETGPDRKNRQQDTLKRPEGYYYKAHYPIKVREFGRIRQDSHKDISIMSCKPKQDGGIIIEVVSKLNSGVNSNDIVYLCDDLTGKMIPLTVNSVKSNVRFLLNPMNNTESSDYLNIFKIVNGLLFSTHKITQQDVRNMFTWVDENGNTIYATEDDIDKTISDYSKPKYRLRVKNNEIPSYAYKVGSNIYLWRDVVNVGSKDAVTPLEYPFANGHFYINKDINFFLKRQDPFGYNGLMNIDLWPNDIYGNLNKISKYEYKDLTKRVC